jgi:outer membrane protein assembly factor BamC
MFRTALVCALMTVALSGCSKLVPKLDKVLPDSRKDYLKAQTLPDLEVPPELSSEAIKDRMAIPEGGKTAKYSTFQERKAERQGGATAEKPAEEAAAPAAVRAQENEHVLSIVGAPAQVWSKLRDFWPTQGYKLELDDADLGVIETGWSEDEAKLSRHKFKLFAEAGSDAATTVLYLSQESQELSPKGEQLDWQRKPRDVEAEGKMAENLQAYLAGQGTAVVGAATASSDTQTTAPVETPASTADTTAAEHHADIVTVGGGKTYLSVAEEFALAWKSTGTALEQVGAQIKDSDKGRGVYIVKVEGSSTETGALSKLKFWNRDGAKELQVSLTGVGDKTEVVVLDRDGRWETGDAAANLLQKLHQALNGEHG